METIFESKNRHIKLLICHIIHTNGLKGENEKISYRHISEQIPWDQFNIETTVNNDSIRSNIYIKDINTLQFHLILRLTEDLEITRINRIE